MPRIKPLEYNEASKEAQKVYDEIEAAFGMVPNLFKTAAHFPPLMRSNWDKVMGVMMQGELTRKTKEAIAVHVSNDNGCDYCVGSHLMMLKSIGLSDAEVTRIEKDLENSDFTEKEFALIDFARKANRDPNKVSDNDFDLLKSSGATEAEIVEALGTMEVFTAFNKFLDSLSVAMDS